LDARLTMFGVGGAGAPANTRPEIGIALKGPIDTPKRTIDVAALASWLALRAVEQQSKKLDVLEGRAPVPPSTPAAVNPPASAAKPKPTAPAARTVHTQPPPNGNPSARTPRAPRSQPWTAVTTAQPGAAATHGTPTQAQQKPAPAPPRPRSLSEILFGPH